MTDINRNDNLVLNLIKENSTIEELKNKTGLEVSKLIEILNKLKNIGYLIDQEFSDSNIIYILKKELELENKITKKISIENDFTRFIAISDTHIGSPYENLLALDLIYNYAIKEGIFNIVHVGDLVQGIYEEKDQPAKHDDIYSQTRYLTEVYPYDKSIFNYILLGNHDYNSIKKDGFDISKYIFSNRLDFVFLGYFYSCINFKNDYVLFDHSKYYPNDYDKKNIFKKYEKQNIKPRIVIRGHLHNSKLEKVDNRIILNVPSLYKRYDDLLQGAWDIKLKFNNNGLIDEIVLRPIVIDSKVIVASKIKEKILY